MLASAIKDSQENAANWVRTLKGRLSSSSINHRWRTVVVILEVIVVVIVAVVAVVGVIVAVVAVVGVIVWTFRSDYNYKYVYDF